VGYGLDDLIAQSSSCSPGAQAEGRLLPRPMQVQRMGEAARAQVVNNPD
jgi:hypothetical protein